MPKKSRREVYFYRRKIIIFGKKEDGLKKQIFTHGI